MPRARRHRFASLGFGVGISGILHWLGIDILLLSAVAVAGAVSLVLLFRIKREFPERWTGESWQDSRWMALSLTVTNFAALVGVRLLPLSNTETAAVSFLIILVGFSAYLGGSLSEMERDRSTNGHIQDNTATSNND